MQAKATIEVDFNLAPNGLTLATIRDLDRAIALTAGDVLVASDGDECRYAVVDAISDDGVLSLRVLWDGATPAA